MCAPTISCASASRSGLAQCANARASTWVLSPPCAATGLRYYCPHADARDRARREERWRERRTRVAVLEPRADRRARWSCLALLPSRTACQHTMARMGAHGRSCCCAVSVLVASFAGASGDGQICERRFGCARVGGPVVGDHQVVVGRADSVLGVAVRPVCWDAACFVARMRGRRDGWMARSGLAAALPPARARCAQHPADCGHSKGLSDLWVHIVAVGVRMSNRSLHAISSGRHPEHPVSLRAAVNVPESA